MNLLVEMLILGIFVAMGRYMLPKWIKGKCRVICCNGISYAYTWLWVCGFATRNYSERIADCERCCNYKCCEWDCL